MHQATATDTIMPPRIGQAYGQVIRATDSPRDLEHRVFAQITASLESAAADPMPGARADAIGRNRQLWDTLTWSVIDDNNGLPQGLRKQIAGLGRWVNRESSRVLRENGTLDQLIEINRIIMRGLAPADAGAAPCPSN